MAIALLIEARLQILRNIYYDTYQYHHYYDHLYCDEIVTKVTSTSIRMLLVCYTKSRNHHIKFNSMCSVHIYSNYDIYICKGLHYLHNFT